MRNQELTEEVIRNICENKILIRGALHQNANPPAAAPSFEIYMATWTGIWGYIDIRYISRCRGSVEYPPTLDINATPFSKQLILKRLVNGFPDRGEKWSINQQVVFLVKRPYPKPDIVPCDHYWENVPASSPIFLQHLSMIEATLVEKISGWKKAGVIGHAPHEVLLTRLSGFITEQNKLLEKVLGIPMGVETMIP